jgi:hypothetical protein
VDDIAVDTHSSKTSSHGNRFVSHHPDLPRESFHLHGESHGGIDGLDVLSFESADYLTCHVVDVVASRVELEIRDGACRASDGLAIHSADKADECSRTGKNAEDVLSLIRELFALYFNEAHVIGAGVEA